MNIIKETLNNIIIFFRNIEYEINNINDTFKIYGYLSTKEFDDMVYKNLDEKIYKFFSRMIKECILSEDITNNDFELNPYTVNTKIIPIKFYKVIYDFWNKFDHNKMDATLKKFIRNTNNKNYRNDFAHDLINCNMFIDKREDDIGVVFCHESKEGPCSRYLSKDNVEKIIEELLKIYDNFKRVILKIGKIKNIEREIKILELTSAEYFEMKKYNIEYDTNTNTINNFTDNVFICGEPQTFSDYMSIILHSFKIKNDLEKYIEDDNENVKYFNSYSRSGDENDYFFTTVNSMPSEIKKLMFSEKKYENIQNLYLEESLQISNDGCGLYFFLNSWYRMDNSNDKLINFVEKYINSYSSVYEYIKFICRNNELFEDKYIKCVLDFVDEKTITNLFSETLNCNISIDANREKLYRGILEKYKSTKTISPIFIYLTVKNKETYDILYKLCDENDKHISTFIETKK